MSKEWLAHEAASELLNPKNIKSASVVEIGSNYPVFTKEVISDGSQSLVRILKAVPKLSAKVVEMGLRGKSDSDEVVEEKSVKKAPTKGKTSPKKSDESEEDSDNPYVGKSAKELYEMCKERGLEVKTRQTANVYAELLLKDDAGSEDEDGDDWEEEVEEEKPVKKAPSKKTTKESSGKKVGRGRPKKEPEPEEEPDDDFDDEDDDDWEV